MTFGERLTLTLKRSGFTQKYVADALGITPTRLNYWIKDKRQPDIPMIRELSALLGVSADYLIGNDNAETGISDEAHKLALKYDRLDEHGRDLLNTIADKELERLGSAQESRKATKVIPLISNRFAAGTGEPDFGNALESYEIDINSRADFAIHISGDSMEPYLHNGQIALGRKGSPQDGDVAALLVDGEFLVKQMCIDNYGNMYLFALNRKRKDTDRTLWARDNHTVTCFGTIILDKRVPLP